MTDEKALLQIKGLTTSFHTDGGWIAAVEDVNLTVRPREIVAVVGESGSGKTVTCLSVIHLVSEKGMFQSTGSILFDGKELIGADAATMNRLRGKDIGMVFQEPMTSLNPVLTIGKQIDETLRAHTKLNRAQRKARTLELLQMVGIPEPQKRMTCYPFELSGGMKQRVMIAMALCCNPKLLIADEPTTALDVTIQAQILQLLSNLKKELNTAIILITHDLGIVAQIAQNVMVMYAGQAVEYADVRTLFKNTLHPYTLGLLKSIPVIGDEKESLFSIKGSIPSAKDYPKGCRFCPRCERATEKCMNEAPELFEAEPGHWVRCWLCEGSKSNG